MLTRRTVLAMVAVQSLASAAKAAAPLATPIGKLVMSSSPRPVEGLLLTRADGSSNALDSYRGKLVVLNLWASWCLPCRAEMPTLSRLADLIQSLPAAVVPLAFERHGADAIRQFYIETGIRNLPVLLGDGDNLAKVLSAWGLPFTVLIDRQGREFARLTGPARWDDPAFVDWLWRQA